MEDFTFSSVGQGSKNGSVVHPFPQNARPISTSSYYQNINFKK
jgi:hypothetical protein